MRRQGLGVLYFDHNATYPLSSAAREAWLDATARFIGNPSSPHRLGERADRALNLARETIGGILGCKPHEIIWTSGATESNNSAVAHLAAASDGEAWVSAIEHPCMLAPIRRHFSGRYRLIPVRRDGRIEIEWLRGELAKNRPAFVGVMAANNETGVLQPWMDLLAICRERAVPFFCDAAQWIGKLPAAGLGDADYVSGCAHKFGGPTGAGFLKVPARLRPLLVGGPQEEAQRAGTENVAGVLAMTAALLEREAGIPAQISEKVQIRTSFEHDLSQRFSGIEIIGGGSDRLWNTAAVVMPEIRDGQRWVVKLDKLGFAVSTGSACASGKEEPSHVLAAMNYEPAQAARALRFSSGWETRASDWSELAEGLGRALRALSQQ